MFSILLIAKSTPAAQSLNAYLQIQNEVIRDCSGGKAAHLHSNYEADAIVIEEDHDEKFITHAVDQLCRQNISAPVIVYSAQKEPGFIVSIMKKGVDDYVLKTKNFDQLKAVIVHCMQNRFPFRDAEGEYEDKLSELYGRSKQVKALKQFIISCAPTNGTIMLYGESGTGKTFIANLIHEYSQRSNFQFRTVNCGAIPETLVESELFGSEVGAFTGAIKRAGVFTRAHHGTLFLDEIGDLPLYAQAKLLQAIEEKRYTPLGSEKEFMVNVRFISATNKNIRQMILDEHFRVDLYYRMAVLSCTVPPLRERMEDITYLACNFLRKNNQNGFLTVSAMDKLMNHSWPGNIRELKNCIARAIVMSGEHKISTRHITFDI